MLYLALQMFIFLLLAFLGGLVLGWLIWGRYFLGVSGGNVQARRVTKTTLSEDDQEAMERLRNELEETRRRRDELEVRNDGLRQQLQEGANTAIATTAIVGAATMEGSFAEDLKADAVTETLRRQNEEYAHKIGALRAELSEYESVDELETMDDAMDDVKDDAMDDVKEGHHEDEPFLQNEAATSTRKNTSVDDDFADDDVLLPNYSSAVTETVADPGRGTDSVIAAETASDAEPDWETDEEESMLDEFVQNNGSHNLQADEDDFEDDGIPVITSFVNMDTHEEDPRTPGLKPRDEVHREVEDAADKTTDDDNYFAAEDSFTEDHEIPSAAMSANTSIQPEQSDSENLLPKYAHHDPVESGEPNEPETAVAPADQSASPGTAPEPLREPIGTADDLKKIRGIGTKLERVLNEAGIYHFGQIAELYQDEVDWLNSRIALPGQIERENWIGQAAELASSRQTEFSLRYTDSDS